MRRGVRPPPAVKALKKQIPLAALGLIAFFLPRLLKPLPAEERPAPPAAEAPADPEAPAAGRLDPFRLLDDEERDIVSPLIPEVQYIRNPIVDKLLTLKGVPPEAGAQAAARARRSVEKGAAAAASAFVILAWAFPAVAVAAALTAFLEGRNSWTRSFASAARRGSRFLLWTFFAAAAAASLWARADLWKASPPSVWVVPLAGAAAGAGILRLVEKRFTKWNMPSRTLTRPVKSFRPKPSDALHRLTDRLLRIVWRE
jgi:hypothetical protein